MRPWPSLREATLTAWAVKVPSVLILLLIAAMCSATLATVGRSAQAEADVLARLDAAGSRELTITIRAQQALLPPTLIGQVAELSIVERAIGLTTAVDVTSTAVGAGGPAVPAWQLLGDIEDVATLTSGRRPRPGEAIVSETAARTLGLVDGVGSVTHDGGVPIEYSVVGTFTPLSPYDDLASGVLIAAPPTTSTASTLSVIVSDARYASRAQSLVLALIAVPDPSVLAVSSPVTLAELQGQVAGDLGAFGRSLVVGVLGVGAVLVAMVVLADVLIRRADLGRRRALGATRGTILMHLALRTLVPAVLGAGIGTGIGLAIVARLDGVPPTDFILGTAALAILTAIISTLAPAGVAAMSDPVRVLRTP